jgi:uncharacterized delta-60 repeat protein
MWLRLFGGLRRPALHRPSRRLHLEALEDRCVPAAAGTLDSTFGGTGVVTTSLGYGSLPQAVLIQPWDGKIVVTGLSTLHTGKNTDSLVRYNTDGSLDSSFGSGGIVVTSKVGGGGAAALYSSTDTTGNAKKIVEAGGGTLARFNANGSVDTSFGSRGTVSVSSVYIDGVVIQPADGKIVLFGDNGSAYELVRYNPNGTLDSTFGVGGTATLSVGAEFEDSFALQADGKFVIGGEVETGVQTKPETPILARFTASGTLDPTFNSTGPRPGTVTFSFPDPAERVNLAVYPNSGTDSADYGKIAVAAWIYGNPIPPGVNSGQFGLARFNPDGTADTTFGQSGQVVTPFPNSGGIAWATALQADGKIVVAGQTVSSGIWSPTLLRYNADGSLDTTFGNGGMVVTSSSSHRFLALAIQADGRIVATGDSNGNFMTARYLAGPEIGTVSQSASTVAAGGTLTLTAANLSDGDPGATITQVDFYAVDSNGNRQLLGYATQASGVWTLTYTVALASGQYTLFAEALGSDGILCDSAFLPLTVL